MAQKRLEAGATRQDSDEAAFRRDLLNIARTTLSSKILTHDKDHFAELAVDAVMRLQGSTNLDSIHIIKKTGGTLRVRFAGCLGAVSCAQHRPTGPERTCAAMLSRQRCTCIDKQHTRRAPLWLACQGYSESTSAATPGSCKSLACKAGLDKQAVSYSQAMPALCRSRSWMRASSWTSASASASRSAWRTPRSSSPTQRWTPTRSRYTARVCAWTPWPRCGASVLSC